MLSRCLSCLSITCKFYGSSLWGPSPVLYNCMRCFLAKKGRHTPCMLSSCTAASGLSRCLYRDSCFRPSITFFGFQIDRIISPFKSARRLLADSLLCRYSSLIYSLCLDLKPLDLLFYAQICGKLFN